MPDSLISKFCEGKAGYSEQCEHYIPGETQYESECYLLKHKTFIEFFRECRYNIHEYLRRRFRKGIEPREFELKDRDIESDIGELVLKIYEELKERVFGDNYNLHRITTYLRIRVYLRVIDYIEHILAAQNPFDEDDQRTSYFVDLELSGVIDRISRENCEENLEAERIIKRLNRELHKRASNARKRATREKYRKQIKIFLEFTYYYLNGYPAKEIKHIAYENNSYLGRKTVTVNYWKEYKEVITIFMKKYRKEQQDK